MEIKRDARIGLAVLLVLALSVTLLVARAMQRTDENQALDNNVAMAPPAGTASSVTFAPGPEESAPEAAAPAPAPADAQRLAELQRFRDDHAPAAEAAGTAAAESARTSTATAPNQVQRAPAATNTLSVTTDPFNQQPAPPAQRPVVVSNPYVVVAPAVPAPAKTEYTVVDGDSPWVIAKKTLGDGKYFQKIIDANPGLDPQRMQIGQKLAIPSAAPAPVPGAANSPPRIVVTQPVTISTTAPALPAAANADHEDAEYDEYVVKSGDTLSHIAHDYYGYSGPKSVKRIVDANPGLDPRALREGMRLKIPVIQP